MQIDKADIKTLSSDTRIEILKSLAERRKMPSELAKEMQIAPPTVVGHLKILKKSGLVEVKHTGHKWKYYELTRKGVNLIKPNFPVQFAILLTIGIIVAVSGFYNITYVSDHEYEYPIISITRTITETITEPSTLISPETTAAVGKVESEAETSDEQLINRSESVENETTYGKTYIPVEKLNWTAVGMIMLGAVIVIYSARKMVKLWK